MTHITDCKTKKAFKEAVKENPLAVYVEDPSIFDPVTGNVRDVARKKGSFTVTNHPKRSWFAMVEYNGGNIKVS